MTPWEEVETTGQLGPAGARLVYKVVAIVARGRGFRPPAGHDTWSQDAVLETAHDFIAGKDGMERFVTLAAGSADDGSFARLLERAVLNHLRTEGRRTDLGKLIRRLTRILDASDEFVGVARGDRTVWHLHHQPPSDNTVPHDALAVSVSRIPVTRPKWTSETRDAPLADEASYLALMRTILARADGAMSAADLARAVATRIDHRRFAVSVELDAANDYEPSVVESNQPTPAEQTVNAMHAEAVFAQLSDRERIVLAHPEAGVRDLGRLMGFGHTQAATVKQRLLGRLAEEFADDEDAAATVAHLTQLCELWVADRTRWGGATS